MENDDKKREWHPKFIKYTEFITNHPNYKGLFFEQSKDGKVKWVVAGKSENGQRRRQWWDNQCIQNGFKIEAGVYAKIALFVHPTKRHTCQICGTELSIEYVYPNKRTIYSLEKEFGIKIIPFQKTIFEIIEDIVKSHSDIQKFEKIFKINNETISDKPSLTKFIDLHFVKGLSKGFLSPGAMSNSPDRFDGFHSDGACCRHESDKGRHKENLQRYGQDRRVYENWADGDWKMADRLMSLFRLHGLSADHIGPISLGFCHRPKFHPLTKQENSAKNNRMSYNDVRVLLEDEQTSEVVSWHSKFIWNRLKLKVNDDKDAVKLSDFMRKNLHHILIIFSIIEEHGHRRFLEQFLNPEYSFYDYRFENFNPEDGSYTSVIQIERKGKNQENNTNRYYRISFEALKQYRDKENRKSKIWTDASVDEFLHELLESLKLSNYSDSKSKLNDLLNHLSQIAEKSWDFN